MKKNAKQILKGILICAVALGIVVGLFVLSKGGRIGSVSEPSVKTALEEQKEENLAQPDENIPDSDKINNKDETSENTENTKQTAPEAPTGTDNGEKAEPTPSPTPTPDPRTLPTEGDISFSLAGHFLTEDTKIELADTTGKAGIITYTMDGKTPKKNGTQYSEPIELKAGGDSFPNVYSIRAKAFYDDGGESDEFVHNYVVSENAKGRFTTPVVFINGNPSDLTDGPNGILYGANYKATGKKSERKVQIEAVTENDDLLFTQFAGVRVFGGGSREWSIKSLKLYARKEYEKDKGTFAFNLFETPKVNEEGKTVKKYDKLVLRNGGDDFCYSFIRDEFSMRLVEQYGFRYYEDVVPAVCYINGEYYGFYWLHESYCDEYFQQKFGKANGEYIVLEGSDTGKSVSGDENEVAAAKEYNSIYSKYRNADFTDDAKYNELNALIDVENYLDYMAFNIVIGNADWPQGNYKCFRYYAADGVYGENEKDGRWRFLMHDSDIGYGTYRTGSVGGADIDDFKAVIYNASGHRYSPLLHSLLKRRECFLYFTEKVVSYLETVLDYDYASAYLDEMCKERDTEMEYYLEHFRSVNNGERTDANKKTIDNNIEKIKTFLKNRKTYAKEFVAELADVYGYPQPEWHD